MYPEEIVKPCREELTSIGVSELLTENDVDTVLGDKTGTTLVVVNSVCGCAAGGARPAVRLALQSPVLPDRLTTVFAGVDREATDRARSYMVGYPSSSPSVALFKDGTGVAYTPAPAAWRRELTCCGTHWIPGRLSGWVFGMR